MGSSPQSNDLQTSFSITPTQSDYLYFSIELQWSEPDQKRMGVNTYNHHADISTTAFHL